MKHIDRVKISANIDGEYIFSEKEKRHISECYECTKFSDELTVLKSIIRENELTDVCDYEISAPIEKYGDFKIKKSVFTEYAFLGIFVLSVLAGIWSGKEIISEKSKKNFVLRNEFTEMNNMYSAKRLVFPFK